MPSTASCSNFKPRHRRGWQNHGRASSKVFRTQRRSAPISSGRARKSHLSRRKPRRSTPRSTGKLASGILLPNTKRATLHNPALGMPTAQPNAEAATEAMIRKATSFFISACVTIFRPREAAGPSSLNVVYLSFSSLRGQCGVERLTPETCLCSRKRVADAGACKPRQAGTRSAAEARSSSGSRKAHSPPSRKISIPGILVFSPYCRYIPGRLRRILIMVGLRCCEVAARCTSTR
ncbi:uncharacterized protein B0I36DRAFT_4814 [Microdochium trichocladiopsis]|uniref:Uncharacterized protein n=1 Tax=Microdochium trichocladiopsis TaxID=1682393 RepID=A0A9P8YGW2_9PEZI|nr:uncharacterized protein B0I36DRAFT_4814 [Microdochium trichocladiopsis]KAH7040055.1 hypothetical protein B0I36DRAFT_4814 [Microdochium trichocladiopsis]